MKAVQISKDSKLIIAETDIPIPSEYEVLIKVKAAGVNYADTLMVQGIYPDAPPLPFVPGYEVSGTVEKLGDKVTNFGVGDKVAGFTKFGGYAEFAVSNISAVRKISDSMSFTEAAAVPVNWLTAYHSIFHTGPACKGYKALVHSAAGGVGIAAVQLLKNAGLEVYGTVGSENKIQYMKDNYGVTCVNYREADFLESFESIVGPKRFDLILDATGTDNIKSDLKLLRKGGRVMVIGVASFTGLSKMRIMMKIQRMFKIDPLHLLGSGQGVYGINMLAFSTERPELSEPALDEIMTAFEEGKAKVVVDSDFKLEDVEKAHDRLKSRQSVGKVVLTVG